MTWPFEWKTLPERSVLLGLFDYQPDTGEMVWKTRDPETFLGPECYSGSISPRSKAAKAINFLGAFAGKPVCRRKVVINQEEHATRRVIWKMVYGIEARKIYVLNGDKTDLRLENLSDNPPRG